jgi:hypothetical protein
MGEYQFDLVAPLTSQSSDMVSVEAVLDMDFFPGGKQGMPCAKLECNYTSLMDSGMDWIGLPIHDDLGALSEFENGTSPR